jgi:hypothetical protein
LTSIRRHFVSFRAQPTNDLRSLRCSIVKICEISEKWLITLEFRGWSPARLLHTGFNLDLICDTHWKVQDKDLLRDQKTWRSAKTNTILTSPKWKLDNFQMEKIWCPWWARVNLPHISNKKYIKNVLRRNMLKNTLGLSFFSWNLYKRYHWDVKYQNSECYFFSWTPK